MKDETPLLTASKPRTGDLCRPGGAAVVLRIPGRVRPVVTASVQCAFGFAVGRRTRQEPLLSAADSTSRAPARTTARRCPRRLASRKTLPTWPAADPTAMQKPGTNLVHRIASDRPYYSPSDGSPCRPTKIPPCTPSVRPNATQSKLRTRLRYCTPPDIPPYSPITSRT
jgi:hypothetical protein